MILGKDIVILNSSGTAVVAAAKSCEIDVQADMIEVASPTTGVWKQHIAGHKSWSLTINHLVLSMARTIPNVGTSLNVKLAIDASNGLKFSGFVDNPNTATQYSSERIRRYWWDITRKQFLAEGMGSTVLNPRYFTTWTPTDDGYQSPADYAAFTYNHNTYTWLNNDLVKESLSGSVIVQTAKVTATVGNLAQGSFVFIGNSALTADSMT